ncbi:MAG TPA: acyl-CoA dehydrogenase family protein [Syntrophales bacterium]|nr:acyl-CoA dehydrogenase family protein [Syntrophales bacterium]
MDFAFSEEELGFRREVEVFAREELPADWDDRALYWPAGYGTMSNFEAEFKPFCDQFMRKMGKRGWLSIGWPVEYGGMHSMMKQAILDDVLTYYRAPSGEVSTIIGGHTIIGVGSDEMKRKWLPRIAAGEVRFWLGYSEPNAGSDLSSIKTSAVDRGDEFVVNGQKIWSSAAHIADYAWLLAKTDPNASKHAGATLMLVDNRSPGITIRPIINICGIHSFNEVFFDDVRVPKENVVGGINQGFYCVMLALQYERIFVGAGTFRRVLEELIQYVKENVGERIAPCDSGGIKRKLAELATEIEVLYGYYWRTAWMMDQGLIPEIESSILKLFATELSRTLASTAMDILGPYGPLERGSRWAPLKGRISLGYLDAVSGPIGAGTSEVQRGIIATRGLGLPRR